MAYSVRRAPKTDEMGYALKLSLNMLIPFQSDSLNICTVRPDISRVET